MKWKVGVYHIDRYMEKQEDLLLCQQAHLQGPRWLDIGCGNPARTRKNFPHFNWTFADIEPHFHDEVERQDIRRLDYGTETFDGVLACRVLSNVSPQDRPQAIQELARVLVPGGDLLLLDSMHSARRRIQEAREELGYPPLPLPDSGEPLKPVDFESLAPEFQLVGGPTPIAPDYVIWTRIMQGELLPYDGIARYAFPNYGPNAQTRFGGLWQFFRYHRR
jgi:SAM-dependent methyltransferase